MSPNKSVERRRLTARRHEAQLRACTVRHHAHQTEEGKNDIGY
jgi:hypothetical protein